MELGRMEILAMADRAKFERDVSDAQEAWDAYRERVAMSRYPSHDLDDTGPLAASAHHGWGQKAKGVAYWFISLTWRFRGL